jgi:AcrR family transcriptional regulator
VSRTHGDRRSTTTVGAPPVTTPAEEPASDPRMTRSRQRALGAALDLVAERGIAGASVEAVSARSGVAKTTVYRQWPNQAALVLDAFRSIAPDPPLPDTGTLRGDLEVLVGGFAEALGRGRAAVFMAALMDAAQRDADFAALHAAETRRRHRPVLAVLARGVERGELPVGTDLDALVDELAGPVLHRRFVSGLPLDRGFGERVVDGVLRACAPH